MWPITLVRRFIPLWRRRFRDFELIVVDDGSPTEHRCPRQISDPRIRLEPRPQSRRFRALAHGIALARAPYLAFLDATILESEQTGKAHPVSGLTPSGGPHVFLVAHSL